MDRTDYVLTENYCDECDQVLHAAFDRNEFFDHKTGVVECPDCGKRVMPCNECPDHANCDNCPWGNTPSAAGLSDEGYVRFLREHEPKSYETYRNGANGEYYAKICAEIEKREAWKKSKKPDRSDAELLTDLIDEVMEYNSLRDDEWAFDEEHGNRDSWDAETCDEHDELLADIQTHRKAIRDLIVEATGDEAVSF